MKYLLIWLLFIVLNVGMARLHEDMRRKANADGSYRPLKHGVWGLIYFSLCMIYFLCVCKFKDFAWSLVFLKQVTACLVFPTSLMLLHLSIFPVFLNRFKGNPDFFLSHTTKALTDRLMVKLKMKSTEDVNIFAFIFSVALLIYSNFVL